MRAGTIALLSLATWVLASAGCTQPQSGEADPMSQQQQEVWPTVDFQIERETAVEGSAGEKFYWTQARIASIPPGALPDSARPSGTPKAIMTMSQKLKGAADVYYDVYDLTSSDRAQTWTEAESVPQLAIQRVSKEYRRSVSDLVPRWHASSQTVLNTGKAFFYAEGEDGGDRLDRSRRQVAYAVYDPQAGGNGEEGEWGPQKVLDLPMTDHDSLALSAPNAGCTQRYDLPGGDVLLPIYYYKLPPAVADTVSMETFDVANLMESDSLGNVVTVVRASFDGETLTYQEHGSELTIPTGRGLGEPSLTKYKGTYYLTLRSDESAWVATSQDGLHYSEPKEWRFDDGELLGSYNTQQHWVTHSDGLFLVYTRRGAGNENVFRNRAPLFIGQVNPRTLRVIRSTERVVVPSRGVGLGNFGITRFSEGETWVEVAEYPRREENYDKNRVWVARIQWNRPNELYDP